MHVSKWPIFSPLFLTPIIYIRNKNFENGGRGWGGGRNSWGSRSREGQITKDLVPKGTKSLGGEIPATPEREHKGRKTRRSGAVLGDGLGVISNSLPVVGM